jgi:peptidoglycan/xylan/chitin deacetylase (PgdA/CDA1 family)
MYHRVYSSQTPVADPSERPWAVALEAFESQMDRLSSLGRIGVSMSMAHQTLASGKTLPPSWVVLTFDDGNESDYAHALPALDGRGFRATFYVCGRRVGASGGLERSMIRKMTGAGMHIGSHAMTHRFLTTLSARDEEDELARSKQLLEEITGETVDHFAPPGGRWSRRTEATLRRLSFQAVGTSNFGFNDAATAQFAYRRIPVVEATTAARFDAMVTGARWRLATGYARAGTIGFVRRLMGDAAFARMRGYR